MADPDMTVCHDLAARFADAHAPAYGLVWGHLRWQAAEALEQVDIPTEEDLADMDQMRRIGWRVNHGEMP